METSNRAAYREWQIKHPDVVISRLVICADGDKPLIDGEQIDGNVYFDGPELADIVVFGDLYIPCNHDMTIGCIDIRGALHWIVDDAKQIGFYGLKELFDSCPCADQLPPNITVYK